MKKINTLLLLMGLMGSAFSQYYTENFNSGTIPAGYVLWNVDGATPNAAISGSAGWTNTAWMIRPVGAGQTDYWIGSPSLFTTNVTTNRWLVTPKFSIPSGSNNVLLEWDGEGYYGYPGTYEVWVSTTDSSVGAFTGTPSNRVAVISQGGAWDHHAVSLQNFAGQSIRVAFRNITGPQTGYAVAIDNINVHTAPSYDMSVSTVDIYEHNWTGPFHGATVQGYLQTFGFNDVTSFNINYSVNGGPAVTATITPTNPLTASSFYYFQHPTPLNPTTDGTYKVTVWCDNINGGNADGVHSNDTATKSNIFFYTKPQGVVKNVIVEEMTGAGCPWCPGGAFTLREVLAANPSAIGVAIHSASINDLNVSPADAMAIPDGETVVSTVGTGLPSGMVDRMYTFDNQALGIGLPAYTVGAGVGGTWDTLAKWRKASPTPVNVSISNLDFNSGTGALSADVNATFLNSLSTGNYRMNLYILEDSITTTGNGYDQCNSIYTGSTTYTGAGALNTMPNPIINDGAPGDWSQNHVLRWMGGGPWGVAGDIPTTGTTAGTTYTHTFTTTVPSTWKPKYMHLVGIVQEYNTNINLRTVLNATGEMSLGPLGIKTIAGLNKLSVYPNPASTVAKVEMDLKENAMVNISIVNSLGQNVTTATDLNLNAGMHAVNVPVTGIATGLYFVKISINGQTTSEPLSIEAK